MKRDCMHDSLLNHTCLGVLVERTSPNLGPTNGPHCHRPPRPLLDLHLSPAMAIALVSITGLAGQKSPVTALLLYVACAFILLLLLASYSPCL